MKKAMPKGFREKGHGPKVAVLFTEELFEKITAMATKEKKNFSTMVCELCKVGILDLEESDACEVRQAEHV
jgi:hypothetical protein